MCQIFMSLCGRVRKRRYRRSLVAIGRALRPFPRPKRSVRLSPHSAFQVSCKYSVCGDSSNDTKVHQSALRLLSFAFLSLSLPITFLQLSLVGLHLVLTITDRLLATTLPPSSVSSAGIFAS